MGRPHKWRRNRLTFRFLKCVTCGGGKRRHVLFDSSDDGATWACSRRHRHVVPWTRDERWQRDCLTLVKQMYLPILMEHLKAHDFFTTRFR